MESGDTRSIQVDPVTVQATGQASVQPDTSGETARQGDADRHEPTGESGTFAFDGTQSNTGTFGQAGRDKARSGQSVGRKAGQPSDRVPPPPPLPQLPLLGVSSLAEPTLLSRVYNVLAYAPLLTLSIIYIIQAFFLVDTRELWYSDEVRHADVLRHMLDTRDWFVLHLNGEFYPDKPPLYFWFLSGLYHFILFFDAEISPLIFSNLGLKIKLAHEGRLIQQVMSLGAGVSGLFFIWASYAFARVTVRFDKRLALAVGLVLLGSLYFVAGTHYARMDLLFATFIVVSQIFFFSAVQRQSSMPLMLPAFFFMALACLCKGPLGALFPLSTVILYLCWQGRPRRLLSRDFLAGLILALVMVGLWGFVLVERYDLNYVYSTIIDRQIIQRTVDAWHHSRPWYDYLWMLPLIWMPFVFVLPFAPWSRLLNPMKAFMTLREPRYQGLCYAWVFFLAGFVGLSLVSTKIHIYLLPLFAPLAVITAQVIMGLPESRSRYFKIILATFVTALIPVFAAPLVLPMFLDVSIRILGTVIAAGIALVFSALFWGGINGRRPEGLLLTWAVFCCVLMQPLGLVTAPSLDAFLSPKAQAEIISKYANDGYYPLSYRVYPGIYSFYTNDKINEVSDSPRLEELLRSQDKLIMAIRLKDWEKIDRQAHPELVEINRQRLAEQEAVLLVVKAPVAAPSDTPAETPADAPGQAPDAQTPDNPDTGNPAQPPAQSIEPAPEVIVPDNLASESTAHENGTPVNAEAQAVKNYGGNSTQASPVPEPVRDQASEPSQEPAAVPAPEPAAKQNPEAAAVSSPESKPQIKLEVKPGGNPDDKPGAGPSIKPEVKPGMQPGTQPGTKPGILDQPDLPVREVVPARSGNIAVSSGEVVK